MVKNELKKKIENLSNELNLQLKNGIRKENYSKVLSLSQELDKLIVLYTKLSVTV
ncbi:aspartyl-phosphate phosphatase Spo0E family protein [Thermobrachium celere]|uniref:Spo0E like sporulation regulatory protein n=1 Tax=Thermobrachium celere DSM 8682 TaxID=941824 RepID=R7RUA3_9CLOT|nr:aspartyl-phosphate phosphatase Spo0E family protein [Thermobrachium celere]GFR36255.1 hypothetical protein TCEA9_20670 [Thermobrachium celere]CDF59006.1 hypothetical protein TCEL_02074 [Thermobrachium celere DSM 8682]